jgi:A/G-specific adenine glycosylase
VRIELSWPALIATASKVPEAPAGSARAQPAGPAVARSHAGRSPARHHGSHVAAYGQYAAASFDRRAGSPEIMLLMTSPYLEPVLAWYSAHARDLPWRAPGATPWSVLVSEIMLQQTPVNRVLPAHQAWLTRWPSPAALAADPPGEAVRQWGRLGYPRRALRLHETAAIVTRRHNGQIPSSRDELLALPGIGAYTAAAVAVFAFGRRHPVLDTNVRRVLARMASGRQFPGAQPSAAEYRLAESLLPADPAVAARWSVAVMELGALTCSAANPRCADCPVVTHCAWLAAGQPPSETKRVGQRYEGTDRQCRGRLLGLLRGSRDPVPQGSFDAVWPETPQRARALDALVADGLVDPLPDGRFALPS